MSLPRQGTIAVCGGRDRDGVPIDIAIVDGVVTPEAGARREAVLDATGCTVAPGFIDLQVNGAWGVDLAARPDGVWEVAAALPRFGVTSFLPTIVSSPRSVVDAARRALAAGPPEGWSGARPLGWHLEGPMIAPTRAGAHAVEHIVTPAMDLIDGWSPQAGVAMVTLAPELPGALAIVAELAGRGVVVSAGHTEATGIDARTAVDAGLAAVTHLFNAMPALHHRNSTLVGAVLADLPVTAGLIADGVHVAPEVLALAWGALGPGRRMLVSDAVAPLGVPPGASTLAGRPIVSDGHASRTPAGGLAGAVAGLDAGVRTIVAATGCAPRDAVAAVTDAPARSLGRHDLGSLRPGSAGDLVVLDDALAVVATIVGGVVAYRRPER